jgi:hypothetical protein
MNPLREGLLKALADSVSQGLANMETWKKLQGFSMSSSLRRLVEFVSGIEINLKMEKLRNLPMIHSHLPS